MTAVDMHGPGVVAARWLQRHGDTNTARSCLAALAELPGWHARQDVETLNRAAQSFAGWAIGYDGRGAVLSGPSGAGKTSAAALMLRALTAKHYRADRPMGGICWTSELEVANARRECGLGRAPELLTRAARKSLLVLDEVGKARPGDPDVWSVIDDRYRAGLVTVVTTPLTLAELDAHLGGAAVRRLAESGPRGGTWEVPR